MFSDPPVRDLVSGRERVDLAAPDAQEQGDLGDVHHVTFESACRVDQLVESALNRSWHEEIQPQLYMPTRSSIEVHRAPNFVIAWERNARRDCSQFYMFSRATLGRPGREQSRTQARRLRPSRASRRETPRLLPRRCERSEHAKRGVEGVLWARSGMRGARARSDHSIARDPLARRRTRGEICPRSRTALSSASGDAAHRFASRFATPARRLGSFRPASTPRRKTCDASAA